MDREYEYFKKTKYHDKTYVICKDHEQLKCEARGLLLPAGNVEWNDKYPHNHPPDENRLVRKKFQSTLRAACDQASTSMNTLKIYENAALSYPDAASLVPRVSVARSMLRWRRKKRPNIPASLIDCAIVLNSTQWRHITDYNGGHLSVTGIKAADESTLVIFADRDFLKSFATAAEMFIDATFEVCPRVPSNTYQLLTIMALVDDTAIAIMWCLMERKTQAAYDAALHYFATTLAPKFKPRISCMDFEVALSSAVQFCFPDTEIHRCYFHFLQAILKRLTSKKRKTIYNNVKNSLEGAAFYRKLISLPLLPAADIPIAFQWLKKNASEEILAFFQDLLQYFERYWLQRVTAEKFSVYRVVHRTNNFIEAYHRVLLHQRMHAHCHIWNFIDQLVQIQSISKVELNSVMKQAKSVRRSQTQEVIFRNHLLNRAWALYDTGELDIPHFLSFGCHFQRAFDNHGSFTTVDQVDALISAKLHNNAEHLTPSPTNPSIVLDATPGVIRFFGPLEYLQETSLLILYDINASKCSLCNVGLTNVISFPCQHWFGCTRCTINLSKIALTKYTHILCRVCKEKCLGFQTIHIS